jgi:hypothetical protein
MNIEGGVRMATGYAQQEFARSVLRRDSGHSRSCYDKNIAPVLAGSALLARVFSGLPSDLSPTVEATMAMISGMGVAYFLSFFR